MQIRCECFKLPFRRCWKKNNTSKIQQLLLKIVATSVARLLLLMYQLNSKFLIKVRLFKLKFHACIINFQKKIKFGLTNMVATFIWKDRHEISRAWNLKFKPTFIVNWTTNKTQKIWSKDLVLKNLPVIEYRVVISNTV